MANEIRLRIDKIEDIPQLNDSLNDYYALLRDYMEREEFRMFIHTRDYF